MSVTSANPELLDEFVRTGPIDRATAADSAAVGRGIATAVRSLCVNRGLSTTNFEAVQQLLENLSADDRFVAGVADALRGADRHLGVASVADTVVAQHLTTGRYDTATAPLAIAEVRLLGEPTNSGLVDDPICAANGNFIHRDLDLVFPGTSASLNLHRFYNSLAADRIGAFGAGWTSTLDVRLSGFDRDRSGPVITAHLADGAEVAFTPSDDGWVTGDRRDHRLVAEHAGWTLIAGADRTRRWHFGADGDLTGWRVGSSIVDVTCDASGRPIRLLESRSRRQVAIEWGERRIAAVVTNDGRSVEYSYGADDTLTRVDSASGWFDYAYDRRLMLSAHDPDGVTQFVNEYDGDGRVVAQTSPFGRRTEYRYEIPGSTVITDERGVRQAMVHDGRGNLTAVIDADGSAMRITYDEHDRAIRVVSRSGAVWQYEFDAHTGDLVRRIDPDQLSQSWEYDDRHRPLGTVDRAGHRTGLEYDDDHVVPTVVIDPDGGRTTATLNAWGQPTSITDPDGVVTGYVWDDDGQLSAITDACGRSVSFEFGPAGLLQRLIDVHGVHQVLGYDAAARLASIDHPDRTDTYRYTPAGRVCGGTHAGSRWTAQLGTHGAVDSMIDATGAAIDFEYDTLGNVVAVTAPDGALYRQQFDEVGRLAAMIAPSGATTRCTYDFEGRVTEVVDPVGRRHTRTLDAFGRSTRSVAPDGTVTNWAYHPTGGIAALEVVALDGETSTWHTEIDRCGRVVAVIEPDGSAARMRFSPAGRLLSRTDSGGRSIEYRFDGAGRPIDPADTGRPIPIGHDEYDERGLLVRAVDPAGSTTSFHYDGRGRLVRQTAPGGRVTDWEYDLDGHVSSVQDPAGVITRLVRDASGVVTSTVRGGIGWTRTLDANGREVERHDLDGAFVAALRYDPLGRLQSAIAAGGHVVDFAWDHVDAPSATLHLDTPPPDHEPDSHDGVLLADTHATVYRLDAAERLVEVIPATGRPTALEYTDDGLVSIERGPFGVRRFRYDAGGRVTAIAIDGVGTTEITYDSAGRRAGELTPDGTLTTYRWNAVDQLVSVERLGPDGEVSSTEIETDAVGRPRSLNGVPVADAVVTRIGSLLLMGARVYDPATRQFLTADPLHTVPGTNGAASAYSYAWQNPAAFADPTGLRPISLEEFEAIRQREERGTLGQFGHAIVEDPWGTALMVGVGLAACAIGGPAGMGIAIGMAMSAGVGFATGTFDPRAVAINGVIGGLSAGAGSAAAGTGATLGRTMFNGAVLGGGGDLMNQLAAGTPINQIDWAHVAGSTELGAATAGAGARFEQVTTTALRSAAIGGATDLAADVGLQVMTGGNPLNWNTVINGVASAGTNGFSHYIAPAHVSYDIAPNGADYHASDVAVPGETTRVGRWMGAAEHRAMVSSGEVQVGSGGTTYVASPAAIDSYMTQATAGSRYVEFDVPTATLRPAGQPDWAQIPSPDHPLWGKLAPQRGWPVPETPIPADNIQHVASKLP